MEQLGFEIKLTPVEAVIARHEEEWRAGTKLMVSDALTHINRMCAQFIRHNRQRAEIERLRNYYNRGERNGK